MALFDGVFKSYTPLNLHEFILPILDSQEVDELYASLPEDEPDFLKEAKREKQLRKID